MQNNLERLIQKVENLPQVPGVYLFLGKENNIIYVGKAKNLKKRVKSYFSNTLQSPKTQAMVKKIHDLDTIVTDNEVEAFILESNLIKKNKPKYNINLKDDKSYPYIVITNEPFPRVFKTRNIKYDGSKYFGPFTDTKALNYSLKIINQIFKVRSCSYDINEETIKKNKFRVCLDYHIKKCDGPCEGLVSSENYNKMIKEVEKLLKGKTEALIDDLKKEMIEFSERLEFEKAEEVKQKINAISIYNSKQKIVSSSNTNQDIIAVAIDIPDILVTIFNIRDGKILGKKKLVMNSPIEISNEEIFDFIIHSYIDNLMEIPEKIIINFDIENTEAIKYYVKQKTGYDLTISKPKSETEIQLEKMCLQNSILDLNELKLQRMKKDGKINYTLKSLQRDLYLKALPLKIECFDISTLQGSETVASLVTFVNGKPKKSEYKKFIIKSVDGVNDFASMEEVISRHYSRLIEEKKELPDLIMVDGGKGQLSSAKKVIDNLQIGHIPIIGLAKRLEEIFFPNSKESLIIPRTSTSLQLLQNIRNEAHRFAITFHRQRRTKRILSSELDNIKGIGPKLKLKLLNEVGSLEKIKSLSIEELSKIIGDKKAKIVYEYFSGKNTNSYD